MTTHHMILAALTLVGTAQGGFVPAVVGVAGVGATYASTFNTHHINHAVAYPVAPAVLPAPAPVAVPASPPFAVTTQPKVAFATSPPSTSFVVSSGPAVSPVPAPVAIAAPAKFGYAAAPFGYVPTPFAAAPIVAAPFATTPFAAAGFSVSPFAVPTPAAAVKVGFAAPHASLALAHSRFVAPNYFI